MNNDLISRSALKREIEQHAFKQSFSTNSFNVKFVFEATKGDMYAHVLNAPAVDAEVVRHEGNTTFVTTDNLDAYADRIIVGQGTLCKVYYIDDAEPVRHGKWGRFGKTHHRIVCSACGCSVPFRKVYRYHLMWKSNYCPNCGANMEDGDN